MRADILFASLVILTGALGTWLLLPHSHGRTKPAQAHAVGYALCGASVLLMAFFWTPPGTFLAGLFFYVFAFAAVAGGILMIASRNPVHSALWFASVVLSTSGLFLLAGAQFLAAGTIIVYAGAIIVTFLFVIMLAQAEGHAAYDRTARAPARATLSCFLMMWGLIYALIMVRQPEGRPLNAEEQASRLVRTGDLPAHGGMPTKALARDVLSRAVSPTARLVAVPQDETREGVPPPHVAGLGGTLFTDHLLSVEIAGAILFVALVGAAAIATPKPPVRPGTRS
jgi:NADH-quinone oxidoreductase subunit J